MGNTGSDGARSRSRPPESAAACGSSGGRTGTGEDRNDDVGDAELERAAGDGGVKRKWQGWAPTVVRDSAIGEVLAGGGEDSNGGTCVAAARGGGCCAGAAAVDDDACAVVSAEVLEASGDDAEDDGGGGGQEGAADGVGAGGATLTATPKPTPAPRGKCCTGATARARAGAGTSAGGFASIPAGGGGRSDQAGARAGSARAGRCGNKVRDVQHNMGRLRRNRGLIRLQYQLHKSLARHGCSWLWFRQSRGSKQEAT